MAEETLFDRTLRIAHIDTERPWRGGEQQVYSLINGLNRRDHVNWAVVHRAGELSQRLQTLTPRRFEVDPFGEWDPYTAHKVRSLLISERIDVVHAHTAHGAGLAALAALATGIPVVISRRVDFPLSRNPFSRWKYRQAAVLLAISDGVKRALLDSGIAENRIRVVRSGVDFTRFDNVAPATKAEMGVPETSLVIGQVAALAPHKDQRTFLRALALLRRECPRAVGVLVGEGEMRTGLEALANDLGLRDHVRFLGFRDDPLRFLKAFDIFCLSSSTEGLGTSVIDAMALRVPVVGTRTGGVPELIEDNVTGYLAPPSDPAALAGQLLKCWRLSSTHGLLLDNAMKKAKAFDVRETIIKTESVYVALMNEQRRRKSVQL